MLKLGTQRAPFFCCRFVGSDLVAAAHAEQRQSVGNCLVVAEWEGEAFPLV
ncbi:hypothetical protein [Rhizobium sp. Root1203]|uniref:hypothetical protein n=1 Tax=Rhizobium sp. Root1203 TaxID=1736427 RepID=UPI0012E33D8D|nr:hypothetical protein [Rhizobium sp. Root1203]